MADLNKRKPSSTSFVDLTRLLDSGVLTLFTLVLSCTFLFMFGELLRLLNNVEFLNHDLVKRGLNRLFPFRVNYKFKLTHALLYSVCVLLYSFRCPRYLL